MRFSSFTQIYRKFAWSGIFLCSALFVSGCHQFRVDSYPEGAKIIVDGQDTGEITPRIFSPRHFSTGMHSLTVEKQGFKTVTPPQVFSITVSAPDIIFSLVPPIFFKNAFHNHWKNERGRIQPFHLKEYEAMVEATGAPAESKQAGQEETGLTRLKQLESLRQQELITADEYAVKRKAILDSM